MDPKPCLVGMAGWAESGLAQPPHEKIEVLGGWEVLWRYSHREVVIVPTDGGNHHASTSQPQPRAILVLGYWGLTGGTNHPSQPWRHSFCDSGSILRNRWASPIFREKKRRRLQIDHSPQGMGSEKSWYRHVVRPCPASELAEIKSFYWKDWKERDGFSTVSTGFRWIFNSFFWFQHFKQFLSKWPERTSLFFCFPVEISSCPAWRWSWRLDVTLVGWFLKTSPWKKRHGSDKKKI